MRTAPPSARRPLTWATLALASLLALVTPRCVSHPQPDIPQDATVTYETVRLEYPGEDPDAALSAPREADGLDGLRVQRAPLVGEPATLRALAVGVMQQTNAALQRSLDGFEAIAATAPDEQTDARFTWRRDDAEGARVFVLGVDPDPPEGAQRFTYALTLEPPGAGPTIAFSGHFTRERRAPQGRVRRGEGVVRLDLDALDGGDAQAGRLRLAFRSRGRVRQLVAYLDAARARPDQTPISAVYRYLQLPEGGGEFAFLTVTDLLADGPPLERVAVRALWDARGAGRALALITGEELAGPVSLWECWAEDGISLWRDSDPPLPDWQGGEMSDCRPAPRQPALTLPDDVPPPAVDPPLPTPHPDEEPET